jgi:hypothetical protein
LKEVNIQSWSFSKQEKLFIFWHLEELESAVAAWLKQARAGTFPTNGMIIREKALQISAYFGVDDFTGFNGVTDVVENITLCTDKSRSVDSEVVDD